MWWNYTTVVIADNGKSREPAQARFAHDRRRMDGWVLNRAGGIENEGLNGGLPSVSYRNLQALRSHPCACKFF